MRSLLNSSLRRAGDAEHIWWGVSVEDRRSGIPRIADLQGTKCRVRFLSVEPLLEDLGHLDLDRIKWVIVGGESGHGARPMESNWVSSIRDQCQTAGTAFFFKQWGGVRKSARGRKLDGRTYDEIPVGPRRKAPPKKILSNLLESWESKATQWQALATSMTVVNKPS
jgi:protein gp37